MPVYRLDLQYDGTEFSGWQVQPGRRTVQGELARALATFCGSPVRVVGAGRTDAGVHALAQVASFECEREIDPERLSRALAALLPPDIHVWWCGRAADGFSARGSARWRAYSYRMLRAPHAMGRRYHHLLTTPVDPARMAQAAARLVGEHDFTAFASTRSAGPGWDCVVHRAELLDESPRLRFEIRANRFLHNMVRRLTGALVEVGRGRLQPEDLDTILSQGDRSRGGPCLPPNGLFLVGVGYDAGTIGPGSGVVDGPPWSP